MPTLYDENGIPCVIFGKGDILIVPIKGGGVHGITLFEMDKPLPINVPFRPLQEGTTDEDVCMCGHKMLVRLIGRKPGDLDALMAVLKDISEEVGGGAEYVSTVQSLRARNEKLERVRTAAVGYLPYLPTSSAREGGAFKYSGQLKATDELRDALAAMEVKS